MDHCGIRSTFDPSSVVRSTTTSRGKTTPVPSLALVPKSHLCLGLAHNAFLSRGQGSRQNCHSDRVFASDALASWSKLSSRSRRSKRRQAPKAHVCCPRRFQARRLHLKTGSETFKLGYLISVHPASHSATPDLGPRQ